MKRVDRFWGYAANRWEERAREFSPEKAEAFQVPEGIALFPQLIALQRRQRVITFQGKAAYAHRQSQTRHALQDRARLSFAPHIPALEGGPYCEIREFELKQPTKTSKSKK